MNRIVIVLSIVVLMAASFSSAQERNIPVFGNWHGEFTSESWKEYSIRAEIIGESRSTYKAILIIDGADTDEVRVEVPGKTTRNITNFEGTVNLGNALGVEYTVSGTANRGVFNGVLSGKKGEGKFELKRVEIKPPSLGQDAPEGAVKLLWQGMTEEDFEKAWQVQNHWQVNQNGEMQMQHSNIVSNQTFSDALYHVEFATPYMPDDRGQARGNSGVYILGKYEVQVLDSFGLPPKDNECGGIYQIATPSVNACLPPLEFQTYDITFHAARFDTSGNKIKNAVITVIHNGITIHDNIELPARTGGGIGGQENNEGPLLIQDHNDLPRFRNIWVKPL